MKRRVFGKNMRIILKCILYKSLTRSETEFIHSRIRTDERVIEFLVSLQIEDKNRP